MTMTTFTPQHWPDQSMEVAVEPRVIRAQFNDGYAQEAQDGINSDLDKMEPRWTNLRDAEAKEIIAFLRPVSITRYPFWWTLPNETVRRAFKCMKFTYAWKKGNLCDIKATFEQTAPQA